MGRGRPARRNSRMRMSKAELAEVAKSRDAQRPRQQSLPHGLGVRYVPDWRFELLRLDAEGWAAALDRVDESVRLEVASICWWDFAADVAGSREWPVFAWALSNFREEVPSAEAVREGLVAVGYAPRVAARKLVGRWLWGERD